MERTAGPADFVIRAGSPVSASGQMLKPGCVAKALSMTRLPRWRARSRSADVVRAPERSTTIGTAPIHPRTVVIPGGIGTALAGPKDRARGEVRVVRLATLMPGLVDERLDASRHVLEYQQSR